MSPSILVITPTFNEHDNLGPFLTGVFREQPSAHVLIVDDASPDGTGRLADEWAANDPRVHVLHRSGKLGLGSAYLLGFRWALARDYTFVFEMDTDLSHDPRHMHSFLTALEGGADAVIGSRNIPGGGVEGWGLGRHILSKGGSLYSRWVLGLSVRDLTSGYKAFHRRVLEALDLDAVHSEGYAFQVELTYRALLKGFRIEEVPILFVDRRAGESKLSRNVFLEAVAVMWKLRLDHARGKF